MRLKKKRWCVYILRCKGGSLYTGISNDVKKRVKAHNSGKGAKYTKMNGPVKLIYKREIGSMSAAMKRVPRLASGSMMIFSTTE